jgi:hypothetical protein
MMVSPPPKGAPAADLKSILELDGNLIIQQFCQFHEYLHRDAAAAWRSPGSVFIVIQIIP